MTTVNSEHPAFKRAVVVSVSFHLVLFPKSSRKGMIHYVNFISLPGGGGGGSPGGGEKLGETPLPTRETLRDLTTPQKLEQTPPSALRHPAEKPAKEKKPKEEKKSVIQQTPEKSPPKQPSSPVGSTGEGPGSGIRLGVGSGSGSGGGFGSEFSSQIGLSTFPYTYYLQILVDRISTNWYTSQISPGIRGTFHTTVFFKIYRYGSISTVKIEESSGMRSLDLSAVRAVQSSAPFPPLPADYEEDYLGIHLIFEHSK
jgi:TonB family protein